MVGGRRELVKVSASRRSFFNIALGDRDPLWPENARWNDLSEGVANHIAEGTKQTLSPLQPACLRVFRLRYLACSVDQRRVERSFVASPRQGISKGGREIVGEVDRLDTALVQKAGPCPPMRRPGYFAAIHDHVSDDRARETSLRDRRRFFCGELGAASATK